MITRYKHYRIARNARVIPEKGRPPEALLYRHYSAGTNNKKPAERGGKTVCEIFNQKNILLASGEAYCSMRDNFNYRIGRRIAQGRAMDQLEKV